MFKLPEQFLTSFTIGQFNILNQPIVVIFLFVGEHSHDLS